MFLHIFVAGIDVETASERFSVAYLWIFGFSMSSIFHGHMKVRKVKIVRHCESVRVDLQ